MTFKLGLTGSIGMGKSTTAKLFEAESCQIWDADVAVHRLYAKDGDAVAPIKHTFPLVVESGAVSREKLKDIIRHAPNALEKIEKIVHPLVAQDRHRFLEAATSDIVVLDIPLLFETGVDKQMDAVATVSVHPDIQRARVLSRGTMTKDQFEAILKKQMPDVEKRKRSDFVITTDSIEHAREQVQNIVKTIRNRLCDA